MYKQQSVKTFLKISSVCTKATTKTDKLIN